jgi:hypothetical protein
MNSSYTRKSSHPHDAPILRVDIGNGNQKAFMISSLFLGVIQQLRGPNFTQFLTHFDPLTLGMDKH